MVESSRMVIDLDDEPKKTLKRKRASLTSVLTIEQKAAQMEALKKEMEGLYGYYAEMMKKKGGFGLDWEISGNENMVNGMVGLLMEESELALSKLVEVIYEKLSNFNSNMIATVALVKSAVLFVGQRVMYGVPNVDADVLEDQTPDSLWCWEVLVWILTRDLKLLPKSVRGEIKIRRICRKKIHERISAVSAMLAALQKSESDQSHKFDLMKASEKLSKVLQEADIRLLVDTLLQKNGAELADKEAKREQKLLIKQLEKNKREVEKEKRRMDLELLKEKRQTEKEHKRLQEETEKDEKRREREESETRRQIRKQQEEAEKEQRRKEREEAELKRKNAIKKQASIMERFLKRSKSNSPCPNDETSTKATTSDSVSKQRLKIPEAVTLAMDFTLSSNDDIGIDNIWKFHLSSWCHMGRSIRSNRKQHWSIRQKPKTELFKELKLTGNRDLAHDDESSVEKLVSGWEQSSDDRSCVMNLESSDARKIQRKQLLQFDKSHRPAFYGIWPKKSHVVGPRHPFRKEPDLDYDVDSDEEWEEEDPGESLSDCDKDDEEQSLEEGCLKDDEDESEDGFFVPDGYLSENEGVEVDRLETDLSVDEARGTPSCKQELENEEFRTLLQWQKYLNNLTEIALRKNQPLIILNLMHEKDPLSAAKDLTGTFKSEKMCLEALSMRMNPGGLPVEISVVDMLAEDQDACLSIVKASNTHISAVTTIQESDMPIVVSAIQSGSHSINKVVELLQQKFPTVSKSQIRNKVREISDFVDNRWQVKKEILDKVGISISPEKGGGRMQNISKFFSKRCLPPAAESINPEATSPEPSRKPGSAVQGQQACT
ncbi:chromatin assembly factor 1 subunit FAS1 isoform X2 [Ricinus communis]|uniref:chromatin assembly factor 1 subunit FAS1 isoform X2 n=1 Tax=Ricinus communis TaxID=3988 RepID=UPI0007726E73|nr:chromatin assembly factor 1 subunit FAS1 isoform X2 [Ricinus communis]|eukprot:XP_015572224.1 chromatin assembly factor 1 subunit FAS1 isoform X2 [Ricinus communis]